MRTVVLGPPPPELAALIARRQQLGLDKYDEVWDGEYHMAPLAHASHAWIDQQLAELLGPLCRAVGLFATGPFSLGSQDDFRVPDRGVHRVRPNTVWVPTAAAVVEIESPYDETSEKLPFYASHGVEEILVVSPARRAVAWLMLDGAAYTPADASRLLGPPSALLEARSSVTLASR
jgi:hypothetical protein